MRPDFFGRYEKIKAKSVYFVMACVLLESDGTITRTELKTRSARLI